MIKLAIDAMGGDFAPEQIVKGVNLAIKNNNDLYINLYGLEEEINKYLVKSDRVTVINALHKLDMGEKDPVSVIRRDKELSMVKAFQAVRDKECQGAVTAGPTQGAVVAAHLIVRRMKGMKRVALCPQLPNVFGKSRIMLDVGANTEIRPEHILQHAQYASIFYKETRGVEKPLVGLINIGTEPGKGRDQEKEVYKLLEEDPSINFYGNVEPKDMLTTECDILVTDGFSGNLVMKTMEGTAKAVGSLLKQEIKKSFRSKIGALFMKKSLNNFKSTLNSEEVGGAVIFGIDGTVVKAHGNSSAYAFSKAIELCMKAVKGNVVETMKEKLSVLEDE
jgi:glycerol-3-phosphate acyltransferase PlsX